MLLYEILQASEEQEKLFKGDCGITQNSANLSFALQWSSFSLFSYFISNGFVC